MGLPVLLYGKSGSGKSRSLKFFGEDEILLINIEGKALPFRKTFKYICRTDSLDTIITQLNKMPCKTAVIDDAGYLMTHHFMDNHRNKKGNASFDMYALKDAFKVWHIDYPTIDYYCSYRVAQKVVPNFDNYSLPCICRELNIDFGKHHRAEGDAIGCANVFIECIDRANISSLEELQNLYMFECGKFKDAEFSPFHSIKYRKRR